jgi:hypothetical protein
MSKGFLTEDLQKFGPFGKYNEAVVVTSATAHFTGSNIGAAAFYVSGSTYAGSVTLARGGTLQLAGLNKLDTSAGGPTIVEAGLYSATSAAATEHIVVLKR